MNENQDLLEHIKHSWDQYHRIDNLELMYPDTIPIIMLKGILNKQKSINKLIDFGCGSGQHHKCVEDNVNEIIGIDYSENALARCRNKSDKFIGINKDISLKKEYASILNEENCNDSIITCFQILDHITKSNAYQLLNSIAKSSTPFVLISLFTEECYGDGIKGNYNSKIDAYLSQISYSLSDKIEMHTFYSFHEIEEIKKIFLNNDYKLSRVMRNSISYIPQNSNFAKPFLNHDYMDTIYFCFIKRKTV